MNGSYTLTGFHRRPPTTLLNSSQNYHIAIFIFLIHMHGADAMLNTLVHGLFMLQSLKDSSRTQILTVNRPSNHPSTTKTRPQMKQARLPTKTAVALGPSY